MPMKFAKGFGRRKSSGNALEYDQPSESPQSSFRVLERPQPTNTISFDSSPAVAKRFSGGRFFAASQRPSAEDDSSGSNRGSGGSANTTNSASTGFYDSSSAASARFSSHSTLPSAEPDEELFPVRKSKTLHPDVSIFQELPPPPKPKERTFSFGRIGKKSASPDSVLRPKTGGDPNPVPSTQSHNGTNTRERAQTTSSYTTASSYSSTIAPLPKFDSGPTLEPTDFGNDFGNMFDGIGKRSSTNLDETLKKLPSPVPGTLPRSESEPSYPPKAISRSSHTPSPLRVDREREIESSPYSWDSQTSNDGLVSSPRRTRASPSPERRGPLLRHHRMESTDSAFEDAALMHPGASRAKLRQSAASRATPQRYNDSKLYTGLTSDGEEETAIDRVESKSPSPQPDQDLSNRRNTVTNVRYSAGLAAQEGFATKGPSTSLFSPSATTGAPGIRNSNVSNLFDDESDQAWKMDSHDTTPRATRIEPHLKEDDGLFDSSPLGPASMAIRPKPRQESPTRTAKQQNKVMTPAQYEIYKRHQENFEASEQSKEDDSDEDAYDDEDDAERHRQLAKQRQKQEAHLAVYRQKMMKVTGEQPSDLPNAHTRPAMDRSNTSGSSLTAGFESSLNFDSSPGQSSRTSDEEDEDVPLGILAAHGFPNRNRPPTRLSQSTHSIPQQSAFPGAPPSTMGGSTAGSVRGSVLPAFAKNLPADPYFGAGLVTQPTREALAFNNNSSASVYGGSNNTGGLPPGGLVGVIAGEERARAARRGSPNAANGFNGMPLPSNMPGRVPQGGMPGMPPGMSTNMGQPMLDPAQMSQMQMNQQMTQMMAMQMQWMQQMMTVQQSNGAQMPSMPSMPPMPQMPGMGQMPLMNMGGQQTPIQAQNGFLSPPVLGNNGRTMSMTNPPSNFNANARHTIGTGAPSLAAQMSLQSQNVQSSPRTMSMMNPPSGGYASSVRGLGLGGNQQGGYAPSIAPSERSTVGQPSRYRPVTADAGNGSVASENTVQPLNARSSTMSGLSRPPSSGGLLGDTENKRVTIKAVEKTRGTPNRMGRMNNNVSADGEDEDDEAGWAEMKKMKERMKSGWKRKGKAKTETMEQQQNEGLEGPYYRDN